MLNRLTVLILVILIFGLVSNIPAQHVHDHDHDVQSSEPEKTLDGLEDHNDHDSHAEHNDELIIQLTPEAVELSGIKISSAKRGRISNVIDLHGEIGFNEDRLVHIAPRFAGIAIQAKVKVGEYVEQGSEVATIESNESMNAYSIKSPISGWVIERHITPGEYVSEENSIYVIADLSTVWVNMAVYPKDADKIKKGQIAEIRSIGSDQSARGTIEYITPILDQKTRNATARIILPNQGNSWRPGTFIHATVANGSGKESLLIEIAAIQNLDDSQVVFVADGPAQFRAVEVITGESDADHIQIIEGLAIGTKYVSDGSFDLKAKMVTSNLDPHAGHGH